MAMPFNCSIVKGPSGLPLMTRMYLLEGCKVGTLCNYDKCNAVALQVPNKNLIAVNFIIGYSAGKLDEYLIF